MLQYVYNTRTDLEQPLSVCFVIVGSWKIAIPVMSAQQQRANQLHLRRNDLHGFLAGRGVRDEHPEIENNKVGGRDSAQLSSGKKRRGNKRSTRL